MEESNSSQPSKCPCGFWGSAKTHGLCSRCYQEHLQKSKEAMQSSPSGKPGISTSTDKTDNTPIRVPPSVSDYISSTTSPQSSPSTSKGENLSRSLTTATSKCESSSDASSRLHSTQLRLSKVLQTGQSTNQSNNSNTDLREASAKSNNASATGCNTNPSTPNPADSSGISAGSSGLNDIAKTPTKDDSGSEQEKRGTKRNSDVLSESSAAELKSPQKNKKRCNQCSCKLELAQRTIGRCRCGYLFCPLHRLPELHNCDFDHKEDGRREAREKMLKPKRHMGTSCKRIDSDS